MPGETAGATKRSNGQKQPPVDRQRHVMIWSRSSGIDRLRTAYRAFVQAGAGISYREINANGPFDAG